MQSFSISLMARSSSSGSLDDNMLISELWSSSDWSTLSGVGSNFLALIMLSS